MATNQQVIDRWLDGTIGPRGLKSKNLTATADTLYTYATILGLKRPWAIMCQRQSTHTSKEHLSILKREAYARNIKTLSVVTVDRPETTIPQDIAKFKRELRTSLRAINHFPHRHKNLSNLADLALYEQLPFPYAPLLPVLAQMQERPFSATKEDRWRCQGEAQALLTMIALLENHAAGQQ